MKNTADKPKIYALLWQKLGDEEGHSKGEKLDHLDLFTPCLTCRDVHCSVEAHISSLDAVMLDLLETIQECADLNLMMDSRPTNKRKANYPN